MPIEKLRPSFSFDEERINELKIIAPEAFADGKINWETLKEALGEHLEEENSEIEHFGLFWPGKREARKIASIPSQGTLIPVHGEGLKADGSPDNDATNDSHNIFIEGENLEVLKILQKSYAGRIKLIYIDPPYNTGNDFIYDDNFTEPLKEYLKRTGQLDEEGKPLTSNKKADGRFHSKWLSMMYPRLKLARNLLQEDGVIFVSIDDNEIHNLKALLNEIFGEENFRGIIVWQHSIQPKGYTGKFSIHHNFQVCYTKNSEYSIGVLERTEEHNKNYSNSDNDPLGPWRSGDVRNSLYRKNLIYDLVTPSGNIVKPPDNGWRWSKETMSSKIKTGEVVFIANETKIMRKIHLNNLEGRTPESIWFGKEVGTTRDGISELKNLYDDKPPFDTPKPTKLISRMVEIVCDNENDIVLDFFAGSGTTGHSTIKYNTEKGTNIKFILVQLQEPIDDTTPSGRNALELGLPNIAEVGKNRIGRYASFLNDIKTDKGFRCYRLGYSFFDSITDFKDTDIAKLELHFDKSINPFKESFNENVLYEILLIEGFPLDSYIDILLEFNRNKIFKVSSDQNSHSLLVCLDKTISESTINDLTLDNSSVFICLDSAITDKFKISMSDKGLIKTI